MKRKNTSTTKKPIAVIAIMLMITCLTIGCWWYLHTHDIAKQPSTPTPEQILAEKRTDAATKQEYIENSGKGSVNPVTVTPPTSPSSLVLNALTSGDDVVITSKVTDYPNGTCSLTITNGEKTRSYSAPVLYQPEYSSCQGFSIPKTDLGSGTWSFTLTITSSSGASVTSTTSLEVS